MTAKTLRTCDELLHRIPENYQWIRARAHLPATLYDEAIGLLEERSRSIEGLRGLYHFGPVRFPGLSDVDLLFIVDDDFSAAKRLRPLLRAAQDERFHAVLLHDPFFIRASELPDFFKFAPFFQYVALWKTGELPAEAHNEDPLDLTLFLADIVAESYPREFIQFLLAPAIDERDLIGRLKGLAYCFQLLERIGGGGAPEFDAFAGAIEALRGAFFSIPLPERARRTLELAQQAVLVSAQLAQKTAAVLRKDWGLRVEGSLGLACAYNAALYTDRASQEPPRYGVVHWRKSEVFALAPAELGWLVREYARPPGPMSARLRRAMIDHLTVIGAPPAPVIEAIRRRAELRNRHVQWLDRLGLGLAGFLTFGYPTRRGDPLAVRLRRAAGHLLAQARQHRIRQIMIQISGGNTQPH